MRYFLQKENMEIVLQKFSIKSTEKYKNVQRTAIPVFVNFVRDKKLQRILFRRRIEIEYDVESKWIQMLL